MNRIRLLPEQVANQIAAGEVVERPASVVKELVENALDAGARRVTVDIQAGGRSLVRVTDDGQGMNRDDALLCFERHATSKIKIAQDLDSIGTMGFRGEAMPSIASVSRLTLTTREREGDSGEATRIVIAGGKIADARSASGPPGTCVEVRNLFFNLPARRKFLRSEETERAHIQHYLTIAALAHPKVGFTFTNNRRIAWQLPPVRSSGEERGRLAELAERLREVHGAELRWLPVDHTQPLRIPRYLEPSEEAEVDSLPADEEPVSTLRVWGFIGAPGISRATREDQHLFVNRRPIEHRGLNFALLEGYRTALMKGRYPVASLFLELDPALVDVNIHPAKREVKFRLDRQVRAVVTNAVRQTLLAYHQTQEPENTPTSPDFEPPTAPPSPPAEVNRQPTLGIETSPMPAPVPSPPREAPTATAPAGPPSLARHPSPTETDESVAPASFTPAEEPTAPGAIRRGDGAAESMSAGQPASRPATAEPPALLDVPLRLVGVIGRLYVVLESDRGLVLLDQHAAHERVLFEQMLRRLESGEAPCQRLLLPETVELTARDADFVRQQLGSLARLGVGLSEFGDRTFLLDGLPPFVKAPDARQFVIGLLDELRSSGAAVNSLRLGEDTIAKTVCRHAVKANDTLSGRELETLIADLRRCEMPYTCPHGRPTLIEMGYRDLEKRFGRTA